MSPTVSDCPRGLHHPPVPQDTESIQFILDLSLFMYLMYMKVDLLVYVFPACPGEMSIQAVFARANRVDADS